MQANLLRRFSESLQKHRLFRGWTQADLASRSEISRPQIVRMENGIYRPDLDELLRLAAALRLPLDRLISGSPRPSNNLAALAIDLFQMGIKDLEISDLEVPGSLREPEEVIILVLSGDRPEVRVLEALPVVLARVKLRLPILVGFVQSGEDRRVATRLGWLCDVTLALGKSSTIKIEIDQEMRLQAIVGEMRSRLDRTSEPDSLGHPSEAKQPLLWRRWNINYSGTLDQFRERCEQLTRQPQ